jgi:predicted RNA-binding Zn-ribbon protein involved in translation (DUF1610 family)
VTYHLRCRKCHQISITLRENAENWKCPHCSYTGFCDVNIAYLGSSPVSDKYLDDLDKENTDPERPFLATWISKEEAVKMFPDKPDECPCSQWILDLSTDKFPCPECGQTGKQIKNKIETEMTDCLECQKQREINQILQQIIAIAKADLAFGEQQLEKFIAYAHDIQRKMELTAQVQEMRSYANNNYVHEEIERYILKCKHEDFSIQEAVLEIMNTLVDFPFGPIPHWIRCLDDIPPKEGSFYVAIFNRYCESVNQPDMKERVYICKSSDFVTLSGVNYLNPFYTWWLELPKPPFRVNQHF